MVEHNRKKILIVEDDGILRQLLVDIFSKSYVVAAAEDGEQAVNLVAQHKPDLILLDLLLPKKDGYQVLTEVRQHVDPVIAKTHVIVMSNLYSNEDILKAENLIIDAYFVKAHTNMSEVQASVAAVISQSPK